MKARLKNFFKLFGPSVITGVADDDPSGIATYTQAGSMFGTSLLWSALFTYPLVVAVQSMCARIGMVTEKGLIAVIKEKFPSWLLYFLVIVNFIAIVLNIGADIQAMGAVGHMLFPMVSPVVFSVFSTFIIFYSMAVLGYNKLAMVLKWLCLSLCAYFVIPFIIHVNWSAVANSTLSPRISFSKDYIMMFVAILGTTISPYLFFWQASIEVEERRRLHYINITKKRIAHIETDVKLGMLFTNLGFYFIILTAGCVLHPAGIINVETVDQAAQALKPIAGNYAYIIFALGVLGTGFLAIPVLAGSIGYMFSDLFGWEGGLSKKWDESFGFYAVMAFSLFVGLAINLWGFSPIQSLIYAAVLYGITSPILIGVIMVIANDKKLMGNHRNKIITNVFGVIALIVISVAAIALVYSLLVA